MRARGALSRVLSVLAGGVAALSAAAAGAASCEMLRGATMSFVVPYSAGGGFDAYARLLEPYLERQIAAEVVVQNIAGAGGMIGSKAIREARPDGRTIGIVNGTRLAIRHVIDGPDIPSPHGDFTVLGQVNAAGSVWVAAVSSPLRSIHDVVRAGRDRALVFGAADTSGEVLAETALTADLLGIGIKLVTGYGGSQPSLLALLRGEIDLYALSVESALLAIDSGEARPLLQLADRPLADHPALAGVPLLAGADGLAARRASELGRPIVEARAMADAIVALTLTRRPVVAPSGLEPSLAQCLERALVAAATDPGFVAEASAAGRSLDVLPAAETTAHLQAIAAAAAELRPALEGARSSMYQ